MTSNELSNEQLFLDSLFTQDDLGAVIRTHLIVENLINEALEILAPCPESIKDLRLDYNGKLNLLCVLGMDAEVKQIFSALGGMRNKFAHKLSYKLDKEAVNTLYQKLRGKDKDIIMQCHDRMRKRQTPTIPPYGELPEKDKFILIAVAIRALALVLKKQTIKRQENLMAFEATTTEN